MQLYRPDLGDRRQQREDPQLACTARSQRPALGHAMHRWRAVAGWHRTVGQNDRAGSAFRQARLATAVMLAGYDARRRLPLLACLRENSSGEQNQDRVATRTHQDSIGQRRHADVDHPCQMCRGGQ